MPFVQPVRLPSRTFLYRANEMPHYAYFLTSGLASIVSTTAAGCSAEVNMVGNEGLAGALHLVGPFVDSADCFMQGSGAGLRISLADLKELLEELPDLRRSVLEFVQAYTFNTTQIACCNRLHEADARLARWLMMARSRLNSGELSFTHDLLSTLLGASRPTVSLITGELQRKGLIRQIRGKLIIEDPERLKLLACECLSSVEERTFALYRGHA